MTEESVSSSGMAFYLLRRQEAEWKAQHWIGFHFRAWLPGGMLGAFLCVCVMAPGRERSQRREEERVALL